MKSQTMLDSIRRNEAYTFPSPRYFSLTWKNISHTVRRKKNVGYLMGFLRGRPDEHVQILHEGYHRTDNDNN